MRPQVLFAVTIFLILVEGIGNSLAEDGSFGEAFQPIDVAFLKGHCQTYKYIIFVSVKGGIIFLGHI